ncbi:MAG: transporter [Parvularculaceae bacterium]
MQTASAAPITFNTALPVSKGEFILRQQLIVMKASDQFAGVRRDVTQITGLSVLGYGAARKLALFGVLPVVNRDVEVGDFDSSEFGLGDARLFARYEIFRDDGRARTIRLAPFAGLTVPTGEDGKTGDGSVDAFGGVILTAASADWIFDGQVQYIANREADGFERGDAVIVDASIQRRLLPRRLSAQNEGFLFAVLEANVTDSEKDRIGGITDPDSGGTTVSLSPGVQYAAKRWIAEAAVRVPVVKDLNGAALEPDYSVIASLRVNF